MRKTGELIFDTFVTIFSFLFAMMLALIGPLAFALTFSASTHAAELTPNCRIFQAGFDQTISVPEGTFPTAQLPSGTTIQMQNYEGGFIVDLQDQLLNFQLLPESAGSIRFRDVKDGKMVSVSCSTRSK